MKPTALCKPLDICPGLGSQYSILGAVLQSLVVKGEVKEEDVQAFCSAIEESEYPQALGVVDWMLAQINSAEIRQETLKVLLHVNLHFFLEGASSTGKFHPDFAQGVGGLLRHTVAAVAYAVRVFPVLSDKTLRESTSKRDCAIAALILHDTCKSGLNWDSQYTCHEHPLLAVELAKQYASPMFVESISRLIASHMGKWTTSSHSQVVLPAPNTLLQEIVHACDYFASRRYLSLSFSEDGLLEKDVEELPLHELLILAKENDEKEEDRRYLFNLLELFYNHVLLYLTERMLS